NPYSNRVPSNRSHISICEDSYRAPCGCKRLPRLRFSFQGGNAPGRGFRCERGMAFRVPSHTDHPLVIRPNQAARTTGLLYQAVVVGAQRDRRSTRCADRARLSKLVPAPSRGLFFGGLMKQHQYEGVSEPSKPEDSSPTTQEPSEARIYVP